MRNMEKVYDCILELSTIAYNLALKKKLKIGLTANNAKNSANNSPRAYTQSSGTPKAVLTLTSPKNIKSPGRSSAMSSAKGSPRERFALAQRNWSFDDVRLAIAAEVATDKLIAPIPAISAIPAIPAIKDSNSSNTLPTEN